MTIDDILRLTRRGFTADEIRGFGFSTRAQAEPEVAQAEPEVAPAEPEVAPAEPEKDTAGELIALKDELRKLKERLESDIKARQERAIKSDIISAPIVNSVADIMSNKINGKRE